MEKIDLSKNDHPYNYKDVKRHIDGEINRWALKGYPVIISLILGYIISTVWDLNGKIYEVAGKQEIQYDVIDELKDKLGEAEYKIEKISLERDALKKENYLFREDMAKLNHQTNLLSLELKKAREVKK